MSELNYQQSSVMQRAEHQRDSIQKFNESLRNRVSAICVASTAIVGIITAAKFLPETSGGMTVESVLLGVVCGLSVLMYWFASDAMLPAMVATAGSYDTDELFDEFLVKDVGDAYNNFLIDICEVIRIANEQNAINSRSLQRCIWVFQAQLMVLAVAIAWTGICKYFMQ